MLWIIIAIVAMSACLYVLGYCAAKLDSLKKFKKAMDKIHADALNRDLSDEEILTDPAHGDFDARRIIDFVDPETGKTVRVDACFEEVDGKWQEIGKKKWYALRKKHGERLATILKEKED
jgi:hypothetical protein